MEFRIIALRAIIQRSYYRFSTAFCSIIKLYKRIDRRNAYVERQYLAPKVVDYFNSAAANETIA